MKKLLSTLIVSTMLVFPAAAYADTTTDSDNLLKVLSFDKIADEMKARSPLIESSWDAVSDGSDKLDDGIDALKGSLTGENGIDSQITYYSGKLAELDSNGLDPKVNANLTEIYQYIIGNLTYSKATINTQIKSLEDQQDDMWKSYLQVESAEDQIIWGAQQLFLSYQGLDRQFEDLKEKRDIVAKGLEAARLQETLGFGTKQNVTATELQLRELNLTLDNLSKGLDSLKGQLNVMLGQEFDTPLELKQPESVALSDLNAMDYDEDLDDALNQSIDVRMQDDSDKREDKERSFKASFHQSYEDVKSKQASLDLAKAKFDLAKTNYDIAYLKYDLGMISKLEFDNQVATYHAEVNKVTAAQDDLLKAYTAYDWMKKGFTISATAGSSSAQTGSAAGGSF